ncbi:MAG: carbohydrate binding domain-containing protein [Planctomycetaceae bacterium]|jgi:hypothetical protein|nr:carbohydrate binding domain-containing protein [Planctomycetaceae bacterium]
MKKIVCVFFVCFCLLFFCYENSVRSNVVADESEVAFDFMPLFPFVISPDRRGSITDISSWNESPAGKDGFIRIKDGHFVNDKGRVLFFGTNICYSACFPDKDQAAITAARLASFGFNCVRLHHMDETEIWGGNNAKSLTKIDPVQLDKLDYFIHQLKQHGIYVNINLHVTRKMDKRNGFLDADKRPMADKGLDNFYPPFIELQKKFARDLLLHFNPYTKTTYSNEPAVAMIEINNENSVIVQWGWGGKILKLPEPYSTDFIKRWNDFLIQKYKTTANLKKAWHCADELPGEEMLVSGKSRYRIESSKWEIEKDDVAVCEKISDGEIMKINVQKTGKQSWHPQLVVYGLTFDKEKTYTFTIKIRANKPSRLFFVARKGYGDWKIISRPHGEINVDTQWKKVTLKFTVEQSDTRCRFDISGFNENEYEIAETSLRSGGKIGELHDKQTLENRTIPIIPPHESTFHQIATDDFCEFLSDIEEKYWLQMYTFLKDELKVHSPISGTQAGYGLRYIQAKLDYIDAHSYWNHPEFPNNDWSRTNWMIKNTSIVREARNSTFLTDLASLRVYGKPFVVSEFDSPFPNQYTAEALPLLSAFGRFQGWDGFFHFAYSHNKDNFNVTKIINHFDIAGNTVKLAHLAACAAIFRRGDVEEGKIPIRGSLTKQQEMEIFKRERHTWNSNFSGIGIDRRIAMTNPVAIDLTGGATTEILKLKNGKIDTYFANNRNFYFDYRNENEEGFGVNTKNTFLYTGFCNNKSEQELTTITGKGGIKFIFTKPTRLGWKTISMVSMNGNGFDPSANEGKPIRVLLTATGLSQNTGMQIKNFDDNKITLGNRWGESPVLCEGIPFDVYFQKAKLIHCFPLDENGNRRNQIKSTGNHAELNPKYKTVWYEIIAE